MAVLLLILGLLLFVGLVVVHEWGHFIAARRSGVDVEEFGIGFPPRAWKRKIKSPKGDFLFSINWLPIGGFVRLKGEHDADKTPGSFGTAPLSVKLKIMLAGIVMNLIVAFGLLTILAWIGMPKLIDNQFTVSSDMKIVDRQVLVGYIEPGSPAEKAGLKVRDQIVSIDAIQNRALLDCFSDDCRSRTVEGAENLRSTVEKFLREGKQELIISAIQNGENKEIQITPRSLEEVATSEQTTEPKGYIGVSPTEYVVQRSTWSAPIVAAGLMKQITELTYKGIGSALSNLVRGNTAEAGQQVAGPVGIFVILRDGSLLGFQFTLMIIAIISLTLAIINVLPIPALDGGRLFVTLLFRALRRPLKQGTEDLIHGAGFALLMLLFVVITVVDVRRFF